MKIKPEDMKLDAYEQEIEDALERGEFKRSENADELMQEAKILARNTLRKDTRITIRLSSRDLGIVKMRAAEEGLPYQTLIASIIHKFADGKLG